MSFRSLSETCPAFYATIVPTLGRSRVPGKDSFAPSTSRSALTATRPVTAAPSSGAIDHWSVVLLYSMGIGTLAVAPCYLPCLMSVWMYGQFVWTFTHWDLADVRLAPFKSLAYLIISRERS